ncbi:MAG: mitochondrial fission ELM1 family protein [Candidatus Omnitrophica bacterium]|nr:mitochondrial fission ELM1 family protein [Candidatus Omnitrophota bacterium]
MKKTSLLVYAAFVPLSLLMLLARVAPLPLMYWLGRSLGNLAYHGVVKRRRVADANLKAAFPGKYTYRQRQRIIRLQFENLGLNFIELLLIPRLSTEYLRAHTAVENLSDVEAVLKQGKGIIFLTAHYGNWEMMSIVGSKLLGFPISVLARDQKPEFLNRILNRYRQSTGTKVVGKGSALRALVRVLRENGMTGILGDQSGRQGKELNFFGRPVFFADGAFRLAASTGCAVIPVFTRRENVSNHRIVFEEPLLRPGAAATEAELDAAMRRYRDVLERYIGNAPEQWMWGNKRWKYTRARTALLLSDGKTGHLRQTQGLAGLIAAEVAPYQEHIERVEFKSRLRQFVLTALACRSDAFIQSNPLRMLRWALKPAVYERLEGQYADIIICSGAATRAVALLLARENGAKTIAVMNPVPFSPQRFDLAVIPEHDQPVPGPAVVRTTGALHVLTPAVLQEQFSELAAHVRLPPDKKYIGLLVGGSAKQYTVNEAVLRPVVAGLKRFAEAQDAGILFTASRRTDAATVRYLHECFDAYPRCVFAVYPAERNYPFAVGGILSACGAVVVSGESISMVSEAASAAAYTIVFKPGKTAGAGRRHALFMDIASRRGHIRVVDPAEVFAALQEWAQGSYPLKALDDCGAVRDALRRRILR